MKTYILAIDQGTTSSRVCAFDQDGRLAFQAQKEFPQIFPKPGWVEHNLADIWETVRITLKEVAEKVGAENIKCIGITNQRETVGAWRASNSEPIMNAIVWQCRRTTDDCAKLRKSAVANKITQKTGLVIDPYFSASKISWMFKNHPEMRKREKSGDLKIGTMDTFLLWKLTNGQSHGTDVSNASRTMLMNLKTLDWDDELLKIFKISKSSLPEIKSSNSFFGQTQNLDFLPNGIPITGILGDQQAALFGQGAFSKGEAKCTFGTGSFILLNTGSEIKKSKNKLLTTVAWRLERQKAVYALEGGAFVCGAAVQWLRDGLGLIKTSSEVEALAESVETSEGVTFVPALTGLGAPHWDAEARGLICGLTRGSTKAHIARATLDAISMQNADILLAMQKDSGLKLKKLRVDGGATQNKLLMQIQADDLGVPVERPKVFETTAFGAALIAGLGCGLYKNLDQLLHLVQIDQSFSNQKSTKLRLVRRQNWEKALQRVR